MPINKQQLWSSVGLLTSGVSILLITFQTMHGRVVAQEVGPGSHDRSGFSFEAWSDPELPTSPFYISERARERFELMTMDEDERAIESLARSHRRLETAKHSWQAGFYAPTMVTLHKGYVYLHEAAHTWPSEDYSELTPVADAYVQTLTEMSANGFSAAQKDDLDGMLERVEIMREQFHF